MNEIVTTHVLLHGKLKSVSDLKKQSQVVVVVRCKHGEREVRWSRRNNLCHKCCAESGAYNTSPKGRTITWGDKISEAKKGVKFRDEHKEALSVAQFGKKHSEERVLASLKNRRRGQTHPSWTNLTDQHRKIRKKISNQICVRLTSRNLKKTSSISSSLSYSIDDLCLHLESKFWPGMNWGNQGKWHIDHVIPDSWFSYDSDQDDNFKKSWALENLQPLWSNLNSLKNNTTDTTPKIKIHMLCGQSGVGKTTLSSELEHTYRIVSFDKLRTPDALYEALGTCHLDKPIIVDIPFMISRVIKDLHPNYEVVPTFLVEDVAVIKSRLEQRSGKTKNIERRYGRIKVLAERYSIFTGNYASVKDFFLNGEKTSRNRHDSGEST